MSYSKKYFNEKYEVIIDTKMKPIKQQEIDGVITPHKQEIVSMRYYNGFGSSKTEINLSVDFILHLADHIRSIESVVEDLEQQENLPF